MLSGERTALYECLGRVGYTLECALSLIEREQQRGDMPHPSAEVIQLLGQAVALCRNAQYDPTFALQLASQRSGTS